MVEPSIEPVRRNSRDDSAAGKPEFAGGNEDARDRRLCHPVTDGFNGEI